MKASTELSNTFNTAGKPIKQHIGWEKFTKQLNQKNKQEAEGDIKRSPTYSSFVFIHLPQVSNDTAR